VHDLGNLMKELHVKMNHVCLVLSRTTPLRNILAHRTQAHSLRWFFLEMVNRIELPYRAMDFFRYVFPADIARELDHPNIAPSVTCQVSLINRTQQDPHEEQSNSQIRNEGNPPLALVYD